VKIERLIGMQNGIWPVEKACLSTRKDLPMFMPALRRGLFWVMLFAALGVLRDPSAAAEVVRVGGTGSGLGTIRLLSQAFEKKHPGITVRVLPSVGSSGAIKAVSHGALEIGLVSRRLRPEEQKLGLRIVDYATTPFVLVTGKRVNSAGLSHDELVLIYRGKTRSWPNGERIRVVLRPAADADTMVARGISSEMSAAMDSALSREGLMMALTNQEALDIIEKTPGSLGFSSLAQIRTENRSVKMLSYNGVNPSLKNLANGAYPLSLKFTLVTRPDLSSAGRHFIDFVRSRHGSMILEKTGSLLLGSGEGF